MILISPTAYKGTPSPWTAARAMERSVRENFPQFKSVLLPLADGGDGTLEVLLKPLHGKLMRTIVRGPMGKKVKAQWGWVASRRMAIIEMAEASGLKWVKGRKKILEATSFGTGQLIRAALNKGARIILVGVGGTATSDGGAGLLQALGLRYFDKRHRALSAQPQDLARLSRVDRRSLDPRLSKIKMTVLCDVKNPLLGKNGSARIFGPQKGASPSQVKFLETMLKRWSHFSKRDTSRQLGAGAAGAAAFGLSGFIGAQLVDGCYFIMKILGWEKRSRSASLVMSGEGRLDKTSFEGKVIGAICHRKKGKVAVVCGSTSLSHHFLKSKGVVDSELMGRKGLDKPANELKKATARLLNRLKLA